MPSASPGAHDSGLFHADLKGSAAPPGRVAAPRCPEIMGILKPYPACNSMEIAQLYRRGILNEKTLSLTVALLDPERIVNGPGSSATVRERVRSSHHPV